MKKSRKRVFLVIVLMFTFTGCFGTYDRTYKDGETQKVGFFTKLSDIFMGKPDRPGNKGDKENPDSGLLPIITSILGTVGIYGVGHLLDRKKLHRLRAHAEAETKVVMAGYQEVKEGLRGDPKSLDKAKLLFNTGMKVWNDSKDNATIILEGVADFKEDYQKLRAVHKDTKA